MDLLNITGEEGLGLLDLTYAFNDVPTGLQREITDGVLQASGGASIFSGFVPSAQSASGPVQVGQTGVANRALLSQVVGGKVVTGNLVAGGADSQAIDISTYAAGTYGIFVAFSRVEAEPQSRSVWSGVDLADYSKVVPTRLAGIWQVRIENPAPGPEWLRIGDAVITSGGSGQGNTVAVVDKRPLFFEGTFEGLYRPTWGTAADRTLRRSATITNLAQMLDALKQCLIDIKGPNIARWYDSFITGLNVGPDFLPTDTPTPARVAVGDARFYLQGSSTVPSVAFDGATDYLQFNRVTASYNRVRGGTTNFTIGNDGRLLIGNTAPLYGSVGLSVQTAGGPRTAMVISTAGYGSLGVGSIDTSLGAYIGLGSAAALGTTPQFGIFATTSGGGRFELQTGNNVWMRCTPASAYSSSYLTEIFGTGIKLLPQNGSVCQVNNPTFYGTVSYDDRSIYYSALPWAVGNFSAANGNPNGRRVACSRGCTFNVDGPVYGYASGGDVRAVIIFNDPLPANAVISAGAYNISDDGTNQRGFACTPQLVNSQRVDFYLARGNEGYTYGSFWFRVDYNRN